MFQFPHEQFDTNDGVDYDNKDYEKSDVEQRYQGFHYRCQNDLQTWREKEYRDYYKQVLKLLKVESDWYNKIFDQCIISIYKFESNLQKNRQWLIITGLSALDRKFAVGYIVSLSKANLGRTT